MQNSNQRKLNCSLSTALSVLILLYSPVLLAGVKEKILSTGKTTMQSSTAFGAAAPRAVDGNRNGNFNGGSITHTNNERKPFWQMDLGGSAPIDLIRIFNRTDCCRERLSNVFIFISN
ncbi:MAG TPA: hypothetical protein VK498_00365, partial [Ferruginibacter sp.]|nr:hypothetical protein [Ferruginibacter sp.]